MSVDRPSPDVRPGGEVTAELVSILQGAHIPCWILDEEGRFTWVNDAFVSAFGDHLGDHYSAVVAPESVESATRHFESGALTEVELEFMLRDGSRASTEVSSFLLEGIGLCCGAFGLAGTPVRPRPSPDSDLTPRQLEILSLMAGGASTKQIAAKLYLSTTTVRNHASHILQALDVHSRLAAVAKARRDGLIDD